MAKRSMDHRKDSRGVVTPIGKGLGRHAVVDEQDQRFLLRSVLPRHRTRDRRYWWPNGWWGDQEATPHCVEYSAWHKIMDGPRTLRLKGLTGQVTSPGLPGHPEYQPGELYCMAQKIDEWHGDCDNPKYDGTSVRAGVKVLHHAGIIDEYRWAWDLETAIRALLEVGVVIAGTWWYAKMFETDSAGYIWPEGRRYGGHAFLVNGISIPDRKVRIKNSWGRDWGLHGMAWITFDAFEHLIRADGEICVPFVK